MKKNMTEVFSTNLRNALYMAGKTQAELAKVFESHRSICIKMDEWCECAKT